MAYKVLVGDVRDKLKDIEDNSIQCVITSPPYFGLRNYHTEGQLGLEPTPEEYVANMVDVFREVKRVLRDNGIVWLNLGDSFAGAGDRRGGKGNEHGQMKKHKTPDIEIGLKPKDLIGIPWSTAFALRDDGWYLRAGIPWIKGNPMPESIKDRPTANVEYFFLLSKNKKYYYDADSVRVPMSDSTKKRDKNKFNGAFKGQFKGTPNEKRWQDGREIENPKFYNEKGRYRRVIDWFMDSIRAILNRESGTLLHDEEDNPLAIFCNTKPYKGAHYATFPPDLIIPMVKASTSVGSDIVLDPFVGSGTTLFVAEILERNSIGIDIDPKNVDLIDERMEKFKEIQLSFGEGE